MELAKAQALKTNVLVRTPPDRGDPARTGLVAHVGSKVCHNHQGHPYVWVLVDFGTHKSSWPSNRLG